jgi:hypothetical protein
VGPGEEAGHGLGEVAQRLLLHHLAAASQPAELGAGLGELGGLRTVPGRAAAPRPPPGVLLDGEVSYVPGVGAVLTQDLLLFWCWRQPVAGHDSNLVATADILEGVKRRFLPGLNAGVSTPRIR